MDKNAFATSEAAVLHVVKTYFHLPTAQIVRGDHGKPFLSHNGEIPLFFSVSHTADKLFIAFSNENVGLDAEKCTRQVDYAPIIKRFSLSERKEIVDMATFLKHWTVKESAVKWLGGSLAHDLYKLRFEKGALYYGELQLPVALTFFSVNGCLLTVCSERDFADAEIINV